MTDDIDDDDPDTTDRLASIEQQLARQAIASDYGLDGKQADAVCAIVRENNLPADEALVIAEQRHADLFADRLARSGRNNPSFGSLTPRPGGVVPQKADDFAERLQYAASLRSTDKRAHSAVFENMVGSFMARAMNWDHQKIPLPGSGTRRR